MRSQNIIERWLGFELNDGHVPVNGSTTINLGKSTIRIHRVSYVGELGYELHIANEDCSSIYHKLFAAGADFGLKNAGYRAFYSLGFEKGKLGNVGVKPTNQTAFIASGKHQWGFDLRPDDTPIETNLDWLCRRTNAVYKGQQIIAEQRANGINKRLAHFTIDEKIPLWGFEGVYRNGEAVGILRRADFGHTITKSIGNALIKGLNGHTITDDYLQQGKYEIDVMGQLHDAKMHLFELLK